MNNRYLTCTLVIILITAMVGCSKNPDEDISSSSIPSAESSVSQGSESNLPPIEPTSFSDAFKMVEFKESDFKSVPATQIEGLATKSDSKFSSIKIVGDSLIATYIDGIGGTGDILHIFQYNKDTLVQENYIKITEASWVDYTQDYIIAFNLDRLEYYNGELEKVKTVQIDESSVFYQNKDKFRNVQVIGNDRLVWISMDAVCYVMDLNTGKETLIRSDFEGNDYFFDFWRILETQNPSQLILEGQAYKDSVSEEYSVVSAVVDTDSGEILDFIHHEELFNKTNSFINSNIATIYAQAVDKENKLFSHMSENGIVLSCNRVIDLSNKMIYQTELALNNARSFCSDENNIYVLFVDMVSSYITVLQRNEENSSPIETSLPFASREDGSLKISIDGDEASSFVPFPDEAVVSTVVPYHTEISEDIKGKIDTLKLQNDEVVGWLEVPGTVISEPVMQNPNEEEYYNTNMGYYYISHDEYRNKTPEGAIFMDIACAVPTDTGPFSKNTIIYGHNLGNNSRETEDDPNSPIRFAPLLKFAVETVAAENPYIPLVLGDKSYLFEIFSAAYVDIYFPYVFSEYGEEEKRECACEYDNSNIFYSSTTTGMISEFRERSLYDYEVEVNEDDNLLILSTCSFEFGPKSENPNQRFIIVAKLVEVGEEIKTAATLSLNTDWKEPVFH